MNISTNTVTAPPAPPVFALSSISTEAETFGRQTLLKDGEPVAWLDLVYAPNMRRPGDTGIPGAYIGVDLAAADAFASVVAHRDASVVLAELLTRAGVPSAEAMWETTKILCRPGTHGGAF